jgi:hypothetical protein
MLKNDTIRSILESGGFVLEEVLQDAGYMLKVRFMCILSLQQCARLQDACIKNICHMLVDHMAVHVLSGWRADNHERV